MRIFVDDGLSTVKKKITGIGWYTVEQIEIIQALGHEVSKPVYPAFFMKVPDAVKRLLYIKYFAGRYTGSSRYDVIHYTNFFMPAKKHRAKTMVTIHDLSPYYLPETFPPVYRAYATRTISNSMLYADRVCVPSLAVKNELITQFPEQQHKIVVMPTIIRDSVTSFLNSNKLTEEGPFFLYVGVLEKRKNLEMLCRAFREFSAQHRDVKLVLVGKPGYGFEDIEKEINSCSAIEYRNYVEESEMMQLYADALAFVFPSLYEGFGKPVVEAMYFNIPIIASDIPTNVELHQKHGEKLQLFGKRDAADLKQAMENIYSHPHKIEYPSLDIYRKEFVMDQIEAIYRF
ncbi:MAG: hypothetical protein H6Q26_480 [Bacteroidetes bacterium]|uniref:glycosyltransferase family 4 protein n=1 Tax=[Flexibacter] sp. ATCC 35208 TaxID=1936242 RepID=UPI0009C536A5|nr:glycosyltransferase family 1 protein [[Flexibacter] sp. ATCC 35208]MBP1650323.1 hypothetical protein [Bacteroidota bacterium]OMP77835.1 hypothetical protein BW716_18120 [[Flexibacter] sp. ATCC 35208]